MVRARFPGGARPPASGASPRLVAAVVAASLAAGCGLETRSQRDTTAYAIVGAAVLVGLVWSIASDHNPPPPAPPRHEDPGQQP
jgi:hypothetical protein